MDTVPPDWPTATTPTLDEVRPSDSEYVLGMGRLVLAVQELSLARSLPDVQRIVRRAARELIGCDGATIVLRDDDMCFYADEDAIAPLWKGCRFPMDTCVSGWAMTHREAVVIPDIYCDDRVPHAAYRPTFVKSLAMVPIRTLDPVGAIGAYWARERQPAAHEIALLQALADSTSIAMEHVQTYSKLEQRVRDRTAELETANEEIRTLSLTDELTGLNNRRGFYVLAERALRTARDHGHDCLLAFVDVDGLKHVNDEEGHDVGDALIVDVARVLRDALTQADIIARIGGDEFCVFVPESEGDPASLKGRVLAAFSSFNDGALRPYRLSASVGAVHSAADDTTTLDELVSAADGLMYVDKRAKTPLPD